MDLLTQGDKIISRQTGLLPLFKGAIIITLVPVNKAQPSMRAKVIVIPNHGLSQQIFSLGYGLWVGMLQGSNRGANQDTQPGPRPGSTQQTRSVQKHQGW
jgi:hypothetical protein